MDKVNEVETGKGTKAAIKTEIYEFGNYSSSRSSNNLINSNHTRENQNLKIEYVTTKSRFQKLCENTNKKACNLIGKAHNLTIKIRIN